MRRQYLCGVDLQTGRDFTHRRDWIRTRIFELTEVFAIDVCAYAVMSNHCHLVLSVDQERTLGWDDREVARRWMTLFGGTVLVRSFAAGEQLSEAQLAAAALKVDEYRKRLFDISWFMRCLNEPIARLANTEDNALRKIVSQGPDCCGAVVQSRLKPPQSTFLSRWSTGQIWHDRDSADWSIVDLL